MELSQLNSLAQFVGAVGLVVLLPALQRIGVGRATLIVLALLTTTVQMVMWALLAVPSVPHVLGNAGYDAMPYVINGAGILVGVLMPCIRATIATLADTNQMEASVAVGLGSIAAEQTIFAMLAPAVVPPLYASTEAHSPNTCYWLAAVLVALSLVVSLTLPNLEGQTVSMQQQQGCCSCRCTCCEDTSNDDDGRQLGEFASNKDASVRGHGFQDPRKDYTKRLASERRGRSDGMQTALV